MFPAFTVLAVLLLPGVWELTVETVQAVLESPVAQGVS